MNTYQVVLGCLVLLCYLQQQGWAAPSQIENAEVLSQETDVNNQEMALKPQNIEQMMHYNLEDLHKLQRRSSVFEDYIYTPLGQMFRNVNFHMYECHWEVLRNDVWTWLGVSSTMHE